MKNDWHECRRPDNSAAKLCISLNARGEIAINFATWVEFGQPWLVVLLYAVIKLLGTIEGEGQDPIVDRVVDLAVLHAPESASPRRRRRPPTRLRSPAVRRPGHGQRRRSPVISRRRGD